jgi:hypothetical protein
MSVSGAVLSVVSVSMEDCLEYRLQPADPERERSLKAVLQTEWTIGS